MRGLQGIAVTEHNRLLFNVSHQLDDKLQIINGEEVATREGEIIGLFLRYLIPKGLSPEETVRAIKEQAARKTPNRSGGCSVLPYPTCKTQFFGKNTFFS